MTDDVSELISTIKSDSDWRERRRAIISLSYKKGSDIFSLLLDQLNDPVGEVRHAAILALGRLGDRNAVPDLLRPKILASPDANIRWAAVKALGTLGNHRVIDHLINLADDEEWLVSNEALAVLKQKISEIITTQDVKLARILIRMLNINDPDIVDLALEGLRNLGPDACPLLVDSLDSVWEPIRRHVTRTLGDVGTSECVPYLIERIADENPHVRAEAVTALGKITDRRAIPSLIATMSDFNDRVRKNSEDAIVKFGEAATDALIIALSYNKNKLFRCAAISALGRINDKRAIPVLVENLSSSYYLVRVATISALVQYGKKVIEPLLGLLSYNKSDITYLLEDAQQAEDMQTRIRAVRALGDLEDHRSVNLLKTLQTDANREVSLEAQNALVKIGCSAWSRSGALSVIGQIGDLSVLPAVRELLKDDSVIVRIEAVLALGNLKDKMGVEPLIDVAKSDPESIVRRAAVRVLREVGAGSTALRDAALEIVEDESEAVRTEATRILGDFLDEQVIDPLVKLLADSSWSVRFSAENAVCSQGKQAVLKLIQVLEKGPMPAKRRAISALGRIGDLRAIAPLENLIAQTADQGTVNLAKEALKHLRGETGRTIGI